MKIILVFMGTLFLLGCANKQPNNKFDSDMIRQKAQKSWDKL